jgi:hypothetical protein
MWIYPRLVIAILGAKLPAVCARAVSLARAAGRAFSGGVACGIGIAGATLAAVTALVCAGGCALPSGATPANGALSVAWSVHAADGVAVPCESVGARFVALRIRNRASGATTATAFPCPNNVGSAQLTPGLYDVSFQLDAADGTRLAIAPDQRGVSLVSGQLTRLTVALTVGATPQSGLVLSLATSATSNCRSAAAGGAGINGNTIDLEFAAGGCAAMKFTRRLADQVVGTYTVNCSSPQIAACIEKNETLTASLKPGGYVVRARGKIGAVDCWQVDDKIDIPAGSTVSHTLALLPTHGPGC